MELQNLIPLASFYHSSSRNIASRHPYMVEVPNVRTKRFETTFLIYTASLCHAMWESSKIK